MLINAKTIIIGGGLTGVYLAYLLEQANQDYLLIEARDRLGGRIHSPDGFDMGPAWFWPHQPRINALVSKLNLQRMTQLTGTTAIYQTFQAIQQINNPSSALSYRLKGGVISLVDALSDTLPLQKIMTSAQVTQVEHREGRVIATLDKNGHVLHKSGTQLVTTLPLRLLAESVRFEPALPSSLQSAMMSTQTWMASHAKAIIEYDNPFWQNTLHKGDAFSQTGPLMEIHDACPGNPSQFALFGFIGLSHGQRQSFGTEGLKKQIIEQLVKLHGEVARQPLRVRIFDWSNERYTAVASDQQPLNYHPRYGLEDVSFWGGQGILAGTETAMEHGGYLEGALESAERAFSLVNDA